MRPASHLLGLPSPKVCSSNILVVPQHLGFALRNQSTGLQHVTPVCHRERHMSVLLHQQHCGALLADIGGRNGDEIERGQSVAFEPAGGHAIVRSFRAYLDIVEDAHCTEKPDVLKRTPEAAAGAPMGRHPSHAQPIERDGTRGRPYDAAENVEERRLAQCVLSWEYRSNIMMRLQMHRRAHRLLFAQ
jgi:hypothetical protein